MNNPFFGCTTDYGIPERDRYYQRDTRYNTGNIEDPWRDVCEFCPLDDCIRPDGAFIAVHAYSTFPGCLIYDGAVAGKTPAEVLAEVAA